MLFFHQIPVIVPIVSRVRIVLRIFVVMAMSKVGMFVTRINSSVSGIVYIKSSFFWDTNATISSFMVMPKTNLPEVCLLCSCPPTLKQQRYTKDQKKLNFEYSRRTAKILTQVLITLLPVIYGFVSLSQDESQYCV